MHCDITHNPTDTGQCATCRDKAVINPPMEKYWKLQHEIETLRAPLSVLSDHDQDKRERLTN